MVKDLGNHIVKLPDVEVYGTVSSVRGLLIEAKGFSHVASVGTRCKIQTRTQKKVKAEVVGMEGETILLMPYSEVEGIGIGCRVSVDTESGAIFPALSWQGRVLNAFAEPIDSKGFLPHGEVAYQIKNAPPPAHKRQRVKEKIDLGVRSLNTFVTCCRGQRMGIFAGSGVGKSMLVSMMTRYSDADIKVIGLIGERGRELQEFLQDYLGTEGLKNAVVIVATSDESALMRKQAALVTMAVAEFFRDQGKSVLCVIDSVTRVAMAQREIGLSAGEPPTTKGYTPTVFAELPKLLERAGPGIEGGGTITGLFSVLVEGDDHNEPISDAVRGILDGHITLDRHIAERGRFPAVNILRSVSRTMPNCNSEEENQIVTRAKRYLSLYDDMAELIRLGAYRKGSNPEVDEAIFYYPKIEQFLEQKPREKATLEEGYAALRNILENTK